MEEIEKLTKLMSSFPGVGPRQARRFVYFLLQKKKTFSNELASQIQNIHKGILQCQDCRRFYSSSYNQQQCSICADSHREKSLMIIHRDVDLETIERADTYRGYYFVLGGSVPVLDADPERFIRMNELITRIHTLNPTEITLAFHINPEGENTTDYIHKKLASQFPTISITTFGRGLSTGSEIEYADKETIKHAFLNRK